MPKLETFDAILNGQPTQITIDTDPSWGKVQNLLRSIVVPDGRGGQRLDMNTFFDKVLELSVTSGLEVSDKGKMLLISATEMTAIIGEVIKRLPLAKYSENLKVLVEGNPLTSMM